MRIAIPFEELKKAAEPLLDLIKQYGDYHSAIVVTRDKIIFMQEMQGISIEIDD